MNRYSYISNLFLFFILLGPVVHAENVYITGEKYVASGNNVTVSDNYIFQGTAGIFNAEITVPTGNAFVYFTGKISSEAGAKGTINVYGNNNKQGGALWFKGNDGGLSDFAGTVNIGTVTDKTMTPTRDWLVFGYDGKATGSNKAEFVLRTRTDSGILIQKSTIDTSVSEYYLGALSGSGWVRIDNFDSANWAKVHVGAMRTSESDVDVFHGVFTSNNSNLSHFIKDGAGTLVLTNKIDVANTFSSVTINSGALQLGDFGHVYGAGDIYYAEGATGDGIETVTKMLPSTSSVSLASGACLQVAVNSDPTIANAITTNGGALANFNTASDRFVTFSGAISGTDLTIKGTSVTILTNNNPDLTGTVTLESGTLRLNTMTSLGAAKLQFDGGKLHLPQSVVIDKGLISVTDNGGTIDFTSVTLNGLSGTGTLNVTRSAPASDFVQGFNFGILDGDNSSDFSAFTGIVKVSGNAILTIGTNKNYSQIAFDLDTLQSQTSGLYLARANSTNLIGDLSGQGLVTTSKNPGQAGTYTLKIGAINNDSEFNGAFVSDSRNPTTIKVEKTGTGTWTWGEATDGSIADVDNNIDTLTVSNGRLVLARNDELKSADKVIVKAAAADTTAALIVAAAGQKAGSLEVGEGGILEFFFEDASNYASLSLDSLDVAEGANVEFLTGDDFFESVGPNTKIDFLDVTGTSSLTAERIGSYIQRSNAKLANLFFVAGTAGGFTLQADSAKVPEPSTWALLILGALGIGVLRKCGGRANGPDGWKK